MWQRRWVRLGIIWGIWTLVGLLFTSQLYFSRLNSERPMAWHKVLLAQLSGAYLWALATPLVLWLARRFPFERQHWLRNLLTHLCVSLPLIMLIYSIYIFHMMLRPLGFR